MRAPLVPSDPAKHEETGDDPGDPERDQPRVGLMQTEDQETGQLAENEHPRSGRNARRMCSSVSGPEGGRNLHGERRGEQRPETVTPGDAVCRRESRPPAHDKAQLRQPHVPSMHQRRRERPGEQRDGGRRHQRGPVAGEEEVAEPGGIVHCRQRSPRPRQAGGVIGSPELENLREELRDPERCGGDRRVAEQVSHDCGPSAR
jgi:hypothetical protein